jgi:hypothetical protein
MDEKSDNAISAQINEQFNKINFIIMTTAIIRPELHNKSIKGFYDTHYLPHKEKIDKLMDIYHIINIDQPDKLKEYFTLESTIENFNKIIPENVHKIYITPEKPSFLQAYKNIMHKINELNLLNEKNIYWWFEDDWLTNGYIDFFETIKVLIGIKNSAMTFTNNAPIGSFKGGPVMSGSYFIKYFNIENLGYMNDTCDPEIQVRRYISAKGDILFPDEKKIKRELKEKYEQIIHLSMLYVDWRYTKIKTDYNIDFYSAKFNPKIKFYYHIVNTRPDGHFEYLYFNGKTTITNCKRYKQLNHDELNKKFNTESIVYFIVKPFLLDDCGRDFATKFNLIKGWTKFGDSITYS